MSSFWIWGKMDRLALPLPMSLCCLLSALLGNLRFSSVPSFPQPFMSLEVLSVYFPVSPFTILIFPLCFKIFLSSPVDHISFSKPLPNLWISSSPLLYLTWKLQAVCRLCEYLFDRVLFEEALFSFSCRWFLAGWAAMSLTPWPGLWLVWQTELGPGNIWTMKCCSWAPANRVVTCIKNCRWASKVFKCFTWNGLTSPKE